MCVCVCLSKTPESSQSSNRHFKKNTLYDYCNSLTPQSSNFIDKKDCFLYFRTVTLPWTFALLPGCHSIRIQRSRGMVRGERACYKNGWAIGEACLGEQNLQEFLRAGFTFVKTVTRNGVVIFP